MTSGTTFSSPAAIAIPPPRHNIKIFFEELFFNKFFAIISCFGVDILINNAGIVNQTEFLNITSQELNNIISVNLSSVFYMTQKFLQEINNPEHDAEDGLIDEIETKEKEDPGARIKRSSSKARSLWQRASMKLKTKAAFENNARPRRRNVMSEGTDETNDGNEIQVIEKPDEKKAKYFIEDNKYSWNSGMFLFKASRYLEELKKYSPEIYKA